MSNLETRIAAMQLSRSGLARQLRVRAGLSVKDVADEVGVDAATLSRWERGQCLPRRASADRWIAACDSIRIAVGVES